MANQDNPANIRSAVFINYDGSATVHNYAERLRTRNDVMKCSDTFDAILVIATNTTGESRILKARHGVFVGGQAKDDITANVERLRGDGIVMNPDSGTIHPPKKDDAINLPPISNKVEGGGHFGLG